MPDWRSTVIGGEEGGTHPAATLAIKIAKPPGMVARRITKFLYTRKTYERVFEPLIADEQLTWMEAEVARERWKARYVRLRLPVLIVMNMGLDPVLKIIDRFRS